MSNWRNGNVKGTQIIGGIVGKCQTLVENCVTYQIGNITGDTGNNFPRIGGICGDFNTINNCISYQIGGISGYRSVGGIGGYNETPGGELTNCISYQIGNIETHSSQPTYT